MTCLPRIAQFLPLRMMFIFLLAVGPIATAQVDPAAGTQPFAPSVAGPYDQLTPSTSDILITIPVRTKAGTIPFSMKLVGNSHAFVRALSPTSNGWFVQTQLSLISFSADFGATVGYQTTRTDLAGCITTSLSNFAVTDATGAIHAIPGAFVNTKSGTCTGSGFGSGTANDGSGYYLHITSGTPLAYVIYDSSGNYVTTSTSNGITTRTMTDPAGVQMLSNENTSTLATTYTDTLGATALSSTFGEWNGSPDTHVYSDSGGSQQQVQVNYTVLPLKTNFGCANIAELDWTQLTMYFPTSIVMPDGGQFTITYEATPGYPSDITGRIASISYPTGGSVTYTYSGGNSGINCSSGVVPTITSRLRKKG